MKFSLSMNDVDMTFIICAHFKNVTYDVDVTCVV
jgi:hypothetical protein